MQYHSILDLKGFIVGLKQIQAYFESDELLLQHIWALLDRLI